LCRQDSKHEKTSNRSGGKSRNPWRIRVLSVEISGKPMQSCCGKSTIRKTPAMHSLRSRLLFFLLLAPPAPAETSVLLIAGPKSHGPGQHEHPAGCELLAKRLNACGLGIKAQVSPGWPADAAKAAAADTLVIYSDGQDAHAAKGHLAELRQRLTAGKGLVVLHYALEPADAETAEFLDEAIGGHYQPGWSVNPVWQMKNPLFAGHPVTRGVQPFEMEEEFYYHIRFREGVIPLLRALPPASAPGADEVPQTLAWAVENPNRARGFGFTGGHFHRHWLNENFRKLVLNAIVWTAGIDVPENGVTGQVAASPAYQTIDEAIARDDIADVKLHLSQNPECLHKGGRANSRPPLEQAILRNKTAIAILLLESGSNPNSANASLRTPLHLAIDRNNPAVAAALLKAGAKPDAPDQAGWTPLHHAAARNQLETAKALLDGGANPMVLSELGGTPLHEAAASGGREIIRLLLEHKVDPSLKSKQGVTALDLAKQYHNQPAIEELTGR
jgi:type 1 glutamine amidotransferase